LKLLAVKELNDAKFKTKAKLKARKHTKKKLELAKIKRDSQLKTLRRAVAVAEYALQISQKKWLMKVNVLTNAHDKAKKAHQKIEPVLIRSK